MRRSLPLLLAVFAAAGPFAPRSAGAAGELAVYGIGHMPVDQISDFVEGSGGLGVDVAWRWSAEVPNLYAGIGGEYVSLDSTGKSRPNGTTVPNGEYFRLFGGARLLLGKRSLRPFVDAHFSAVGHYTDAAATANGLPGPRFDHWGPGYDVGGGLHFIYLPEEITGFVGLRWLQSFGLQAEPPWDEIQLDPQYWEVRGGVGWAFGFLEGYGG